MGLINESHQTYYSGNDHGKYQFTSLDDVITQFMIAYVGEEKIISKIKRSDVAFHAQRAMQELSFDTFKSIKSQQITLPPTLLMTLPHDYVNYTKISWVDSSGIKHPLYKTNDTSNPFQILQNDDGQYSFPADTELITNADYSDDLEPSWNVVSNATTMAGLYNGNVGIIDNKLTWRYVTLNGHGANGWSQIPLAYQQIDVTGQNYINISADGVAEAIAYNTSSSTNTISSTVRFGVSTSPPSTMVENVIGSSSGYPPNPNASTSIFNLQNADGDYSYLEWTGTENSTKELTYINVTGLTTVYVIALAIADFSEAQAYGEAVNGNTLDNVSVKNSGASTVLQSPIGNKTNSSTWNNYKGITPSENNNDDYEDDTYWPMNGSRFGLDPQHAQANGSFYIDQRLGKIHFSSNVSGKTVILDYISDSLGTDGEMQVHKFAEEAMYKWIAHAVLSTRANTQEYIVQRFKKERFAETRKAKLRLSSIKLEEITQILRGKSKQIKH